MPQLPKLKSLTPNGTVRAARLGVVSFLNAKPLVDDLAGGDELVTRFEVPSVLGGLLDEGEVDVALVPAIDYQLSKTPWKALTCGCIGSHGETMTVRLLSRVPPNRVRALACDVDSHTSVALARVILIERYGVRPEIVPLTRGDFADPPGRLPDSILLIGDKVVTSAPVGYRHAMDLGQAWLELTGFPFVFAFWAARLDFPAAAVAARLDVARRRGMRRILQIVDRYAEGLGWPKAVATEYLTRHMKYDLDEQMRLGLRRFYELAGRCELINDVREVVYEC